MTQYSPYTPQINHFYVLIIMPFCMFQVVQSNPNYGAHLDNLDHLIRAFTWASSRVSQASKFLEHKYGEVLKVGGYPYPGPDAITGQQLSDFRTWVAETGFK